MKHPLKSSAAEFLCGTLAATLMMFCTALPSPAKKITTRLKVPSTINSAARQIARYEQLDSLSLSSTAPLISFSGFDKPASSSKETFLITNDSQIPVARLLLDITYTDLDGRMLHRRRESIDIMIPQGETRAVSIKAFDLQHTLYFKRSTPPRKGGAPFDVKIAILELYRPL